MEHPIIVSPRGKPFNKNISTGVIGKYLATAAGRLKLAQSMISPLRRNINYAGIAKSCVSITPLPQCAQVSYIAIPSIVEPAATVGTVEEKLPERGYTHRTIMVNCRGRGEGSTRRYFGQRVVVPAFEIFSNPTVRITDVKARRFNLIDRHFSSDKKSPITIDSRGKASKGGYSILSRAVQKARQEIMDQVDDDIFQALDNASKANE